MSARHRIHTIYGKELVDIMRDRRTLIAMILVPIVLYPLLMLGSIQAVTYQTDAMAQEEISIGVINDVHRRMLQEFIGRDRILSEEPLAASPAPEEKSEPPRSLHDAKIWVFDSRAELEAAIQTRQVNVGVIFSNSKLVYPEDYRTTLDVELLADTEEVRSDFAAARVSEMIGRVSQRLLQERLRQQRLPESFLKPFDVETTNLSAPPSILGQILPLILVLMTITGAIYPAIDLTAGERERGTLESLMVCPVPIIDLVVGKFLVVTTVAILGATLNLASVTATVYFGGFDKVIAQTGGSLPLKQMLFILLSLIPFAVLMSAIMMAVCSYARTFKEAQNYVTPVIMAVLIPGGIAALPATQLHGIMLVMPVGNMVLLSREFLLGATVPLGSIAMVLLSTTLYAAAAVAVAAGIFGRESVVFSDAGSLKGMFTRVLIKPSRLPSVSMSLMIVALLFPAWFYVQSALSPDVDGDAVDLFADTARLMPLLFVVLPAAVAMYWKVNLRETFALRLPSGRYCLAAVIIGLTAWIPAEELNVCQAKLIGIPEAILKNFEMMQASVGEMSLGTAILVLAIVPAICEELLFRGLLLSGLSSASRKWTAIITSAAMFGVFHFILFRFPVTAGLGVVLAMLCWNSRSILPAIIAHMLHNSVGVCTALHPAWRQSIGIPESDDTWTHLPMLVIVIGGLAFLVGIVLAILPTRKPRNHHPITTEHFG